MAKRKNGPGVFCLSVGIVLAFAGLLTFLAVPAAQKLDAKKAYQEETPLTNDRQVGIVRTAILTTGAGTGLGILGLVLLRRGSRH